MGRDSPPTLSDLRRRLTPFLRGRGVRKAIVFGSFARGTQTRRSDLDLALVIDTEARFLDRYEAVRGIERYLGGLHAELLIYAPGELESLVHRPFIERILTEGQVIYER